MSHLRALGRYVNEPRGLAYEAGTVFEVDPALLAFLLADAPGTFEHVVLPVKAVQAPPRDKAIKTPQASKGDGGVL